MTAKPGSTETRVREALLRLWERSGVETANFTLQTVAIETTDDGGKRPPLSLDGVMRVGRRVDRGEGWDCTGDGRWLLSEKAEATYERGVFRVRKRRTAEDAAESLGDFIGHGHTHTHLDAPVHVRHGVAMPAGDVLHFVEGLLRFPYPQICRHHVAAQLLSELERLGLPVPGELADAVVQANDAEALRLLAECRTAEPELTEPRVTQRHLDRPELPPGYRVGPCDDVWLVGDDDCWFDDDELGVGFPSREDAVAQAWAHFRFYGNREWVEFIDAHGEARKAGKRGGRG